MEGGNVPTLISKRKFNITLKQMGTQLKLESSMLASLAYSYGGSDKKTKISYYLEVLI